MVKDSSAPAKKGPKRFREDRASLRMHPHLKAALSFLADEERRTISQILELVLLDFVKSTFKEEFDRRGQLVRGLPPDGKFSYRDPQKRRRDGF